MLWPSDEFWPSNCSETCINADTTNEAPGRTLRRFHNYTRTYTIRMLGRCMIRARIGNFLLLVDSSISDIYTIL